MRFFSSILACWYRKTAVKPKIDMADDDYEKVYSELPDHVIKQMIKLRKATQALKKIPCRDKWQEATK